MAGNVFTPLSIWKDFLIEEKPVAEIVNEEVIDGVVITRFYIDGKKYKDGSVKIYLTSAKSQALDVVPALFVLPNFEDGIDENLLIDLAKRGYYALSIDLIGNIEGKENFTIYPESISYANYENAKSKLMEVEKDVKGTCWYVWDVATKYALEYLKNLSFVKGIAGLGVSTAATVLWHVCANEKAFFSVAFLFNAGWEAYKDKYETEKTDLSSDMSDEMLKYLAGIGPEAYAPYVNCPIYILSATNSDKFECDRAADTLARVKNKIYTALDYSINHSDYAQKEAYENVIAFFNGVFESSRKINLPITPEIECDVVNGEMIVTAKVEERAKKVRLYASEQTEEPSLRAWIRQEEKKVGEENVVEFKYLPYDSTDKVFFFVQAEYDRGFTLSSAIVMKKFNHGEVKTRRKQNILFSARNQDTAYSMVALKTDGTPIDLEGEVKASIKSGPMNIDGVYSKGGLITYKVNADGDKPIDDAILMADIYVKEDAEVKISLLCSMKTEDFIEYSYTLNLKGGEIWHNVKMEMNRFKSEEGRVLKSYSNVNALKITTDKEYLINNVLWV